MNKQFTLKTISIILLLGTLIGHLGNDFSTINNNPYGISTYSDETGANKPNSNPIEP